jgi:hypothetical protein
VENLVSPQKICSSPRLDCQRPPNRERSGLSGRLLSVIFPNTQSPFAGRDPSGG